VSFLLPRVITITRPQGQTGIGAVAYSALSVANETVIASGIPASIQLKKEGGKPDASLPGGVSKKPYWSIYFNLPRGTVNRRDIITDDLGIRYQVGANYWNSLGYSVFAEELEV